MTFEGLLIHKIYLKIPVSSQNDLGEWITSSTTSDTPISCRLSPLSASERSEMHGKMQDVRYKCFCLSDEDLEDGYRVIHDDKEYFVREVITDSSGHHKTAYLVML